MKKSRFFKWLDKFSPVNHADYSWKSFHRVDIHPRRLILQAFILYPRYHQKQAPVLFTGFKVPHDQRGYKLKKLQRVKPGPISHVNKHHHWVLILLVTSCLLFVNRANADVGLLIHDTLLQNKNVNLNLISKQEVRRKSNEHVKSENFTEPNSDNIIKIESAKAQKIFKTLKQHYNFKDSDPSYIIDDLKLIAKYYSQFPEVINLLDKLDNKSWQLTYNKQNWVTTATGNFMHIENAIINFNTRAAAQLRLNKRCKENPVCIASPADALLHELLHTHSMLIETEKFLAQGGMNNVLYPYKHEYSIIDAERALYKTMSKRDGIKRPQRHEHNGRIIRAHCPTCIK